MSFRSGDESRDLPLRFDDRRLSLNNDDEIEMDDITKIEDLADSQYGLTLVVNACAVLIVSLVAGIMLTFAMAGGFIVWPLLDVPADIIGSVRGWKAAHVGGLTNGIMMLVFAVMIAKVPMTNKSRQIACWCFVATGWGNTLFYWAGNLAANRGVSFHANGYGESSLAGKIAFASGGSVMLLTILGATIVMLAGWKALRSR